MPMLRTITMDTMKNIMRKLLLNLLLVVHSVKEEKTLMSALEL